MVVRIGACRCLARVLPQTQQEERRKVLAAVYKGVSDMLPEVMLGGGEDEEDEEGGRWEGVHEMMWCSRRGVGGKVDMTCPTTLHGMAWNDMLPEVWRGGRG